MEFVKQTPCFERKSNSGRTATFVLATAFVVSLVCLWLILPVLGTVAWAQAHPQPDHAAWSGVVGAQQPSPVPTGAAPPPQVTGQVPPPVPSPGDALPGGTQPQSPISPATDGFPWLPVLLLGALLLALVGFFVLRRRPTVEPVYVEGPAEPSPAERTVTTATTTTATMDTASATTPPSTSTAVVSPTAAPPIPDTITCPNCGTVNNINENFCHECGQDLRPIRTQLLAVAPPEELVSEDMPYLETLDRVDEQLEYVLSRAVVVIGTAPGNDIVIDSAFAGWQTVSPVHAELRREQEGFVLVDRDSESGTFVNELRTGESILKDGDLIRLGNVRFIYHVPTADQPDGRDTERRET